MAFLPPVRARAAKTAILLPILARACLQRLAGPFRRRPIRVIDPPRLMMPGRLRGLWRGTAGAGAAALRAWGKTALVLPALSAAVAGPWATALPLAATGPRPLARSTV